MFLNKRLREIDALITGAENTNGINSEPSIINVKISAKEQLFSAYSYSEDKLNTEFSEYVFDKAKSTPIKEPIKIKIYSQEEIDGSVLNQTLKNHYSNVYNETKKELKRINAISVIMTLLGIIALSVLIFVNHFTDNLYLTSIVEIAAWVFIWEAVDYFFLQRPVIKAKCILIQRIYMAEIEIRNEV